MSRQLDGPAYMYLINTIFYRIDDAMEFGKNRTLSKTILERKCTHRHCTHRNFPAIKYGRLFHIGRQTNTCIAHVLHCLQQTYHVRLIVCLTLLPFHSYISRKEKILFFFSFSVRDVTLFSVERAHKWNLWIRWFYLFMFADTLVEYSKWSQFISYSEEKKCILHENTFRHRCPSNSLSLSF